MQVDFSKVKDFARKGLDKARQYAEGLNELEVKVEEATNSDKWGPHGSLMQEITRRSFVLEDYKQILAILARRLHSEPNQWRHVYKALLLLEYMAKNGPERMVSELKSNGRVFAKLQQFQYTDSKNKDQGINVRNRSKQLWELVNDDDAIAAEREKAAQNKNKYTGADRFGIAAAPSASHSPAPSFASTDASVTRPVANGGEAAAPREAGGGGDADAVAATERRVQQLSVGGGDAGGAASPRAGQTRAKPKLSAIAVDNSIAATFQNFPVKEPPAGSTASAKAPIATDAGSHGALNLLDFDDDPPAAAAPPAASGSAAAAAEDDDWADFSGAAAPHPSTPDPFSGATVPAASAGGAPSVPDDPFSMLAPAAPPPPLAAATAPPAAAPAAPAQSSGRQPLPMDAFAEPLSAVVPQATAALGPATPAVTVQPTAGTSAGPESAANGAAGFDPFAGASLPAHGATAGGAALKGGALKDEKDPFADLL